MTTHPLAAHPLAAHPLAGKPVPPELRIDVDRVRDAYYAQVPDPAQPAQRVRFGTSGHRGRSLDGSFTERHVLVIAQAVCEYRRDQSIDGPLFLGMDTHVLSPLAQRTAIEVFAANGVETILQANGGFTPTPVISWSILTHNRAHPEAQADGVVVTPSHNPPEDGGFKYNPPHGGPAGAAVTNWIERRANALLEAGGEGVKRIAFDQAQAAGTTHARDLMTPYVDDLASVVDLEAIRKAGVHIGVDPLGGASVDYWKAIAKRWDLDLTVVNDTVDPAFGFMTLDHDGRVRMDCSSPYAMAGLIELRHDYDIAVGNDPDADRHGIVSPAQGLLRPNQFLALAIDYLFRNRPHWPRSAEVGKTLVSSALIDRVATSLGRKVYEVPVGFKWFAEPLFEGSCAFAGEESAGAGLLCRDGRTWTTDKDGIALGLLAAEIRAQTGADLAEGLKALTARLGSPRYRRVDLPADARTREALSKLRPEDLPSHLLAEGQALQVLTHAPGNNAPIGGIKVLVEDGWFAARPSGTEDIAKIYAESFRDDAHLQSLIDVGTALVESLRQPHSAHGVSKDTQPNPKHERGA